MAVDTSVERDGMMEISTRSVGVNMSGEREVVGRGCWTLELADAVAGARDGRYAFSAEVDGRRVELELAQRADGRPCLRPADPAIADGALAWPSLGE